MAGIRFEKNPRVRRINEMLLNLSEENFEEDEREKVLVHPAKETWTAWQRIEPLLHKEVTPKRRRNLPPVIRSPEGIPGREQAANSPRHRNFEVEFVDGPIWKMGLEPNTSRYILGNGRYRAHKLAQRLIKERETQRNTGRMCLEQKTLMAFIQKYFKREFEVYLKFELQKETQKKKAEKERSRRNSADHVPLPEIELDLLPQPEKTLAHLPPLRESASAAKAANHKAYVNHRLGVLDEELQHAHSGKRPDTKHSNRSQSEPPPGLGSLVDPLSQQNGGTRKSEKTLREEMRNQVQIQEIADHLIHALSKIKKTRDEELRRRFQCNEVPLQPQSALTTKSEPDLSERPIRRLHIEPLPRLVQAGQNIKYQTSSGDIISVPRFGQYPALDSNPDTRIGRKRDPLLQKKKKPPPLEVLAGTNPAQNGTTLSDQVLQSMITTTKYTPSEANLSIASKHDNVRNDDIGGMMVDGFQPMPIGKPRHRQKRPISPPMTTQQQQGILPEISGKSVNKVITSNRVL
ncbi:hypothetical protein CAPTEDRAFT_204424 [Capitella teleta]|uniref:Uncharacterized protein n=1 Tax=Capitella teleta TaxID=283909 RepID=R7V878_CAPTE|nr:hypothetical protein CAPTEDRAFT_204424 [Capitella teleta]|eukprot:ELU14682.1 hypothetical protein CAPTEDRAFT_204424 [Capitella teleta]